MNFAVDLTGLAKGGAQSARRHYSRLYGLQATELHDSEEQEEQSRSRGVQEVLPDLQHAYGSPRDALIAVSLEVGLFRCGKDRTDRCGKTI